MTYALRADSVVIRCVAARIPATAFDPLAARIELERQLGALDWSIPWLSPSAVLCIKQLPDPRPGTFRLKAGDLRPAVAWQRALLAIVEEKVRRAVRPALGAVPAAAEAVVFADRGELLGCLALDWCHGSMSSHWWWRALFGAQSLDRAVVSALLEAPEYLPPVLDRVVQAGRCRELATQLSSTDAPALLQAMLERFGLRYLQQSVFDAADHAAPGLAPKESPQAEAATSAGSSSGRAAIAASPTNGPRLAWAEARELDSFERPIRQLFAIALSLQRAPTAARTEEFAHETRAYEASLDDRRAAAPGPAPAKLTAATTQVSAHTQKPTARLASSMATTGELAASPAPSPLSTKTAERDEARSALDQPSTSTGRLRDFAPPAAPSTNPAAAATSAFSPSIATTTTAQASPLVAAEPIDAELPPPPPTSVATAGVQQLLRVFGAPVKTELGGLFFLANLALALQLYPDFTRPRDPAASLALWDFIALVGQRLLGGPRHDPLWVLLRQLSGRSDAELACETLTVPSGWLLPAECSSGENEHPPTSPAALDDWLDWLMPHVRARLERALGTASTRELVSVLLLRDARVHVSDSHVDVRFLLAELPIAVRQAGLDRDPGWLPSAGRFLAFHFD